MWLVWLDQEPNPRSPAKAWQRHLHVCQYHPAWCRMILAYADSAAICAIGISWSLQEDDQKSWKLGSDKYQFYKSLVWRDWEPNSRSTAYWGQHSTDLATVPNGYFRIWSNVAAASTQLHPQLEAELIITQKFTVPINVCVRLRGDFFLSLSIKNGVQSKTYLSFFAGAKSDAWSYLFVKVGNLKFKSSTLLLSLLMVLVKLTKLLY